VRSVNRLTKPSKIALDNATEYFITGEEDSNAKVYYVIQCSYEGWLHTLSTADNSIPFSTVDDAVKYLLKRKVSLEKINFSKLR
jgi:hypothetical protein